MEAAGHATGGRDSIRLGGGGRGGSYSPTLADMASGWVVAWWRQRDMPPVAGMASGWVVVAGVAATDLH